MALKISKRLKNEDAKFVFQGGSAFAETIADALDRRQYALGKSKDILADIVSDKSLSEDYRTKVSVVFAIVEQAMEDIQP